LHLIESRIAGARHAKERYMAGRKRASDGVGGVAVMSPTGESKLRGNKMLLLVKLHHHPGFGSS
jgi:hypothetical protein